MSENAFYKLAPFIQEYIYRHKWETLREVQAKAIDAIIDGPNHVLICSATASGKTEAALLPVITELDRDPPASIGALYIGPLKALINDQFLRITGLLEDSDIPAQSWHGDVSQSKKQRFLQRARGILQITPESLEAMLMHRTFELRRLFGDLRFVIIDEVHAFIDSDRGRQVMCQLERLERFQSAPARRIGLSATLGEPELAMDWLRGRSSLGVEKIMGPGKSELELAVKYFLLPSEDEGPPSDLDALLVDTEQYFMDIHLMTRRSPKTLIFANSRSAVEEISLNMRRISERDSLPNFYHAHHGNVSAPYRESAEAAMKEENRPACVAATVTLELGIDLGQLDQVLQINATHSVASFVQRLGRSGRRQAPPRMCSYTSENQSEAAHFGEEVPWNLLQTLAIIQLYAEEKWIEPPQLPRLPFSLLYHQAMSILYSHTELTPPQLAERVLTLSPFKDVEAEQFRQLLRHLLDIEHLQRTERGRLIIGLNAEDIVNNYRFYSVFMVADEFRVRDKSREIGTIPDAPDVDSTLVLAGFMWRVLSVDTERRIVEVARAKGRGTTRWTSPGIEIHTRILQKMRQILLTDSDFVYMTERARLRLGIARRAAQRVDLAASSILPLADNRFLLFPWCGTRQFATLALLLRHSGIGVPDQDPPYYLVLEASHASAADLREQLRRQCQDHPTPEALAKPVSEYNLQRDKYDRFVPAPLLREAYSADYLDIPGAVESISRL
ncbi:MAG: DEAD/DEAH box helicase [Chloroflexi bacterium]|nr:DEAD/DEAH box helicase [Chloroflexota bacterium]